jgi:hypothetical protein
MTFKGELGDIADSKTPANAITAAATIRNLRKNTVATLSKYHATPAGHSALGPIFAI